MSDTENQPQPAPNGGAKVARAPKLAPAPVPQETPWKAPAVDAAATKPNFDAAEAAKPIKKQQQQQSSSAETAKDSGSKRSTTGKEKWVPYAPVVPIPTSSAGSAGSSSTGSRTRQKRQQSNGSGAYRNRRGQGERSSGSGSSSGQANGSADKRKSTNSANPSSRGAGHQRSQSKAGKLSENTAPRASSAEGAAPTPGSSNGSSHAAAFDGAGAANGASPKSSATNTNGSSTSSTPATPEDAVAAGVESSQVNDAQRGDRPPKMAGHHSNSSSNNNGNNNNGSGSNSSSTGGKPGYAMRPNVAGKKSKDSRYGGSHKPHYHQGGFVPNGMPYQMMPIPMAPQDYIYPAEYVFSASVNQINHYFSIDNSCRDLFSRRNMNDEGSVPIEVIGTFNRVKSMTTDLNTIRQACQNAPNLVVIGDKVRAAQNWERWVVPEPQRSPPGFQYPDATEYSASSSAASPSQTFKEPKFQVQHAVPFVPKSN